jgi:hypothetical protein
VYAIACNDEVVGFETSQGGREHAAPKATIIEMNKRILPITFNLTFKRPNQCPDTKILAAGHHAACRNLPPTRLQDHNGSVETEEKCKRGLHDAGPQQAEPISHIPHSAQTRSSIRNPHNGVHANQIGHRRCVLYLGLDLIICHLRFLGMNASNEHVMCYFLLIVR